MLCVRLLPHLDYGAGADGVVSSRASWRLEEH